MSAPPLIDPATIITLRSLNTDGNDDFLKEIVCLFAADLPARIAELERSLAAGNGAIFKRAAHSIKGSAANLGAGLLTTAAERIETQFVESGLEGMGPLITALKAEAARAQDALDRIVASPPAP